MEVASTVACAAVRRCTRLFLGFSSAPRRSSRLRRSPCRLRKASFSYPPAGQETPAHHLLCAVLGVSDACGLRRGRLRCEQRRFRVHSAFEAMCRSPQLFPQELPRRRRVSPKGHAMALSIPRSGLGHLSVAAAATVALAAALLATSPVAAQSAGPSVAAIERRMAELANQSRAAVGAGPVAVDVNFAAASRDWSCQMARTDKFAHDPNFAAGGALAEIIAARSGADGDAGAHLHQQFLDSPAHREILLNPAYTRVGIGVCVVNGYWVTERFGTGAAVAAPAPTAPRTTPSTVRSAPTTMPSTVRPTPTTTQRLRSGPRRAGLVRHPEPGSIRGSLDGSGEIGAQQVGSGALPFTGTSIALPALLFGLAFVLGGGLALRLGRSRYRPGHLRR